MDLPLELTPLHMTLLAAVLAWIGMLVRASIGEQGRRTRNFEKAVVGWLGIHGEVLRKLEGLSKRAVDEPEDFQKHQELLDELAALHKELTILDRAFDNLVVFNTLVKSLVIWMFVGMERFLVAMLEILINHHKTHLEWGITIDEGRALAERLKIFEPESAEKFLSDLEINVTRVDHCRQGLKRDAKRAHRMTLMLRVLSGPFRWIITRRWL